MEKDNRNFLNVSWEDKIMSPTISGKICGKKIKRLNGQTSLHWKEELIYLGARQTQNDKAWSQMLVEPDDDDGNDVLYLYFLQSVHFLCMNSFTTKQHCRAGRFVPPCDLVLRIILGQSWNKMKSSIFLTQLTFLKYRVTYFQFVSIKICHQNVFCQSIERVKSPVLIRKYLSHQL